MEKRKCDRERECEVLGLVAEGCSNAEIADRLVISPRTAEHHVQNIYAKLGTSSRAAAAVFAMEPGLLTGWASAKDGQQYRCGPSMPSARLEAAETKGAAVDMVTVNDISLAAEDTRRTMIHNAPTWPDDREQAHRSVPGEGDLAGLTVPVLLTRGGEAPPGTPFAAVLDRLTAALPHADRHTFHDAGHVPHRTHPEELGRVVADFVAEHAHSDRHDTKDPLGA